MADKFDPYRIWLGIPPAEQPAHHYRLLGIGLFEADLDVIEGAADRQMAHVQRHKIGDHSAESQRLLNELATARLTLLNAGKKVGYDRLLRAKLESQAGAHAATVSVAPPAPPPAPAAVALVTASTQRSQFVAEEFVGAGRPSSRKTRKAVKKSTPNPAVYIVPALLLVGAVAGWLALRNSSSPWASQTKSKSLANRASASADSNVDPRPATANKERPSKERPSPKLEPEIHPADPFDVSQTVAASTWVDLLPLVRSEDAVHGKWEIVDGTLRSTPQAPGYSRLMLPIVPPKEYMLETSVMRGDKTEVDFGLTSGSRRFVLIIDGWANQSTAIHMVDGQTGNDAAFGAHTGTVLAPRKLCELAIAVRASGVALDCNGQRILTWQGGLERLSTSEAFSTPDPHRLFLAGLSGTYHLTKLRLRSLSGEPPKLIRPAPHSVSEHRPPKSTETKIEVAPADTPSVNPVQPKPLVTVPTLPAAKPPVVMPPVAKQRLAPLKVLQEKSERTSGATLSPDGRWAMWGNMNGDDVMWDVRKGTQIGNTQGQSRTVRAAFTPDSRQLVTLNWSSAAVWDLQTGQVTNTVPFPPSNGNLFVEIAPDGRMVASQEFNKAVNFFDPMSGKLLYRLEILGHCACVGLSTGGKFAFVSAYLSEPGSNRVTMFNRLYDVKAQREATCGLQLPSNAHAIAFSNDLSRIAVSASTLPYVIHIWNLTNDKLETTIPLADTDSPNCMAFTPDGRRLLSGSNPTVRLWNVETGQELAELEGHKGRVTSLQTTADGRIALSSDYTGGVRLWRLPEAAGAVIARPTAPTVKPPDEAAQQAAAALIKEVYADDLAKAKKSAEKLALAEKLLQQSGASQDLTEKYVLIIKARDLAREAGEPPLFLQAIETLGATFAVDTLEMASAGADTFARENLSAKARHDLAEGLIPLVDRALADEKYEEARKLLTAAQIASRKSNDAALAKTIAGRLADVNDLKKLADGLKTGEEALAKDPSDPAANLTVGKIYCLLKDDWIRGLPLLAKSADAALKDLASQEIADPKTAADQVKLADGWYALGDAATGKEKTKLLLHSEWWYRRALPDVAGLTKAKVSKRLDEIAALQPTDVADAALGGGEKPAAPNSAASAKPLAVRIKSAIKKQTHTSTRPLGSANNGIKFAEVPPDGGLLIGFNYTTDDNNNGMVSSIQAIYQVGKSAVEGAAWGRVRGTGGTIKAKKGYAVAGLKVRGSYSVAGFEVTFMKIDRGMLNVKDGYASPWIGSEVDQRNANTIGGDGQPVIGIIGTADYYLYSLGFVQLPAQ